MLKLRTTSGTTNIHQQSSPLYINFELVFEFHTALYIYILMVENYVKDLIESVYYGAVVSAVGFTMIGKSLIQMTPLHLSESLILKMAQN